MITKVHTARFNDFDIDSIDGVSILSTDPYKLPRRDVSMSQLARTNFSRTNSAYYVERIITVKIAIRQNTRALTEQTIDTLMARLQGVNKTLVVDQSGGERLYYATLADAPVQEEAGSYVEMELIFTCTDRFGYATSSQTLLTIPTTTSSSRSDYFTVAGSALTQTPIFTITFSAVSGATSKTVIIGNSETGQEISITRTWANTDVITIDTSMLTPSVKVNGTEVDFDGAFPVFEPGQRNWYYNDNLLTRTFTGSITYTPRYV